MDANVTSWRGKAVWGRGVTLAVVVSALAFAGCGEVVRQGHGPVFLQLESLQGRSTGTEILTTEVLSDVANWSVVEGITYIYRTLDTGQATLRLVMKDPLVGPTTPNAVTLTSYRVQYRRTDGRNTPGVDVPYPFDGTVTLTLNPGIVGGVGFTLVRAQAKFEAPLSALTGGGSSLTIATIAHVTFYGHDAAGNQLSVEGDITIYFADWPDTTS